LAVAERVEAHLQRMSGREQNSELRVMAQRDEAYRQLDESLKLQRDAVHNCNSAVKRCAELKNDIETLNILHGNSGGTVGEIMSSSMWSKEAVHVRTFLGRYEPSDVNELCMRASAGIKGEDGRSVLLSWGNTDAAAFDPVKQKIISERDMEIYEHLSEKVLAPAKAELSRLLLRISWRNTWPGRDCLRRSFCSTKSIWVLIILHAESPAMCRALEKSKESSKQH